LRSRRFEVREESRLANPTRSKREKRVRWRIIESRQPKKGGGEKRGRGGGARVIRGRGGVRGTVALQQK